MSLTTRTDSLLAPDQEEGGGQQQSPLFLFVIAAVLLPIALAYGMATASEVRILAMVLGALGLAAVATRPLWGLVIFIALLYTRPEDTYPELAGLRLNLIVSLTTLFGLMLNLALRREKPFTHPFVGCIVGVGLWCIVSAWNIGTMSETAEAVGKVVVLAILVVNLARDRKSYWVVIATILAGSLYLGVRATQLYYSGQALVHAGVERAQGQGIFNDPNDLAATLLVGVGMALLLMVRLKGFWRIVFAALSGFLVFVIILTNSRGGMLSLLVVIFAFLTMTMKHKTLALVMALIVSQGFLLFGPKRMTTFDSTEGSANSRFWFWTNGIDLLKASPITGVGFNRFMEHNGGLVAHNSYVECFAEIGFPGYCFFIGAIYYGFRRKLSEEGQDEKAVEDMRTVMATRLALMGWLAACFWISRTFSPNMFLYIALPLAGERALCKPDPPPIIEAGKQRKQMRVPEWALIPAIAFASIIAIKMIAEHYR